MAVKSGNLSINSENIFPIIKKWLYSDHDIFYRKKNRVRVGGQECLLSRAGKAELKKRLGESR